MAASTSSLISNMAITISTIGLIAITIQTIPLITIILTTIHTPPPTLIIIRIPHILHILPIPITVDISELKLSLAEGVPR